MSDKSYTINPADRIAQILFLPVEKPILKPVADFDNENDRLNSRGDSGFGSTGR